MTASPMQGHDSTMMDDVERGAVDRARLRQARLASGLATGMIALAATGAVPLSGGALWPSRPPPAPSGTTMPAPLGMSTDDLVLVVLCLAITVNGCLVGVLLPRFLMAGEATRAARARGELAKRETGEPVRGVPARVYAAAANIRAGAFGFVGVSGAILVLLLGTVLPGLGAACIALVLLGMTFPSEQSFRELVVLDGVKDRTA